MIDDRMAALEAEFDAVEADLADPATLSDPDKLRDLSRRHKELGEIVKTWHDLTSAREDVATAREMLTEASGDDRELDAPGGRRVRGAGGSARGPAWRRCCCRRTPTRAAT